MNYFTLANFAARKPNLVENDSKSTKISRRKFKSPLLLLNPSSRLERNCSDLAWEIASLFVLMAAVRAADDAKSPTVSTTPPTAAVKPVEETIHGTKVVDKYRWLEDGKSPETQKWVADLFADLAN